MIWDYHVILHAPGGMIYDFDSTMEFPCEVVRYVREIMHPEISLNPQFERYPLPKPHIFGSLLS